MAYIFVRFPVLKRDGKIISGIVDAAYEGGHNLKDLLIFNEFREYIQERILNNDFFNMDDHVHDPERRDCRGRTFIQQAAVCGRVDILTRLLDGQELSPAIRAEHDKHDKQRMIGY